MSYVAATLVALVADGLDFHIPRGYIYSAMAFTNTGVTPNIEGLTPFAHDYWFLFMLMFGVTLGSIGTNFFYHSFLCAG